MSYYVISAVVALTALAAIFSFIFIKSGKCAAVFSCITIIMSALGVLLSLFSALSLGNELKSEELKEEFILWARDTFSSYLKGVCLISAVVMVLCVISFFIKPKQKYIRAVLIFLTVTALLSATPVFAFLANESTANVSKYIKLSGIGISLITLFPLFFDYHALSQSDAVKKNK